MNTNQQALIDAIIDACNELGWSVAIPGEDDQDMVRGLVIGTDEYIGEILAIGDNPDFFSDEESEEDNDDFEVFGNFKTKKTTH